MKTPSGQHEWQVFPQENDQRLGTFIREKIPDISLREVKIALEKGSCRINHRIQKFASYRVRKGDIILFNYIRSQSIEPYFGKNDILLEDDYLLALNKRAGCECIMKSHEHWLLDPMPKDILHKNPHLTLIHRLDRDTSGVILFAKNQDVKSKFIEMFRLQAISKIYVALVDGVLRRTHGEIKKSLSNESVKNSAKGDNRTTLAITRFELLKQYKHFALVKLMPVTGRTHQLRIHMAEIGHPMLGDFKYGEHFKIQHPVPHIMLHAQKISLKHPFTNELIKIEAPVPDDFRDMKQF